MAETQPQPKIKSREDAAVQQTVDALSRAGARWPTKYYACKMPLGRDKTTRQPLVAKLVAETQTRSIEEFDGIDNVIVTRETVIRVHDIEIPECPLDIQAAGEKKTWIRDNQQKILRLFVDPDRDGLPPGIENEQLKEFSLKRQRPNVR